MIKLRLSDIEAARQDPSTFRGGSPQGSGRGLSMMRTLQYAIYEYHKRGNEPNRAVKHLEAMFHKNFKTEIRLPQLVDLLNQYHVRFQALAHTVVDAGMRVMIPVDIEFRVTGEIGRLDLAPGGGYAVWLFASTTHPWRSELRMPLIQGHFAEQMMVQPDRVTVGFYFFDQGQHDSAQYSSAEVAAAYSEARALGAALAL